jgi:predicted Fe-S protein YdhL (DUF1289 family)
MKSVRQRGSARSEWACALPDTHRRVMRSVRQRGSARSEWACALPDTHRRVMRSVRQRGSARSVIELIMRWTPASVIKVWQVFALPIQDIVDCFSYALFIP